MNDIVPFLIRQAEEIATEGHNGWGNTMIMAAEEIERLRARNKRLEEALENFNPNIIGTGDRLNHALLRGAWNKARAELED